MNNHTPEQLQIEFPTTPLCACGCGNPLPKPKFPSRQRRFIHGHHPKGYRLPGRPLEERFWEKVNKRGPDDCWEWTAYCDRDGYGHIRLDDYNHSDVGAHRASYELHFGPIPDGMGVLHKCDNPPCVNPNHLFLGTNDDNMADMTAKGRKTGQRGESCYCAKLTNESVLAIRSRYAAKEKNMYELAKEYGVGAGHICNIVHRKIWKHI